MRTINLKREGTLVHSFNYHGEQHFELIYYGGAVYEYVFCKNDVYGFPDNGVSVYSYLDLCYAPEGE